MLWALVAFGGVCKIGNGSHRYSPAPSPAGARSFLKKSQEFALRYPSPWGWARKKDLTPDELRAKLCPGCSPCAATPCAS